MHNGLHTFCTMFVHTCNTVRNCFRCGLGGWKLVAKVVFGHTRKVHIPCIVVYMHTPTIAQECTMVLLHYIHEQVHAIKGVVLNDIKVWQPTKSTRFLHPCCLYGLLYYPFGRSICNESGMLLLNAAYVFVRPRLYICRQVLIIKYVLCTYDGLHTDVSIGTNMHTNYLHSNFNNCKRFVGHSVRHSNVIICMLMSTSSTTNYMCPS